MFGKQRPQEGKKADHWTVEKLREPTEFFGWIAGTMVEVNVHTLPPSKPCFWIMTDQDLECPYCRVKPKVDYTGYLPLYREGGAPVVVQIHKRHMPEVHKLKLHQPVKAKRGPGKFDTCIVEPSKWSTVYEPGTSGRHLPADVRPWLMNTLWKEGELIAYFARDGKVEPLEPLERWEDPAKQRAGTREELKAGQGTGLAARFARGMQPDDAKTPPTVGEILPMVNPNLNGKH